MVLISVEKYVLLISSVHVVPLCLLKRMFWGQTAYIDKLFHSEALWNKTMREDLLWRTFGMKFDLKFSEVWSQTMC